MSEYRKETELLVLAQYRDDLFKDDLQGYKHTVFLNVEIVRNAADIPLYVGKRMIYQRYFRQPKVNSKIVLYIVDSHLAIEKIQLSAKVWNSGTALYSI